MEYEPREWHDGMEFPLDVLYADYIEFCDAYGVKEHERLQLGGEFEETQIANGFTVRHTIAKDFYKFNLKACVKAVNHPSLKGGA